MLSLICWFKQARIYKWAMGHGGKFLGAGKI
jgi:hypothetical protein